MTNSGRPSLQSVIVLTIAALCVLGASAYAQETPPPAEPPAAAQAAPQPETPPAPQQAQAQRVFRGSWDVIIEGKAEVNGVLELVFEPTGGEAKLVRVNVVAKAKAKQIAKDLANQLAFTTGSKYKVKANDNKVNVSLKDKKAPVFYLGIEQQALTGVSVRLAKG
ncbi:MAG TPA: hypothetical protein PKJ99_05145 [Thermoanaerobaculales bacterium]|nr:hypothetical protein [Thermoanaerobaculales bacterium]HPA80281.1 hypothetical protein [Thermoanaerobaculales bacterium]HQL31334.1 hypothetical protein [Thermoanaerobaculales bacterium]HQN95272.1 hypothetical protein [Thermoanaerobaculales bacterium]HQP43330.1 hypothetical protein [Thermoanaerobaculales bacterium]